MESVTSKKLLNLRDITRDRTGELWITSRVSYQWAIVVKILIKLFGMTFTKPLNGSNSSKNEVHPSLILVYPILFFFFRTELTTGLHNRRIELSFSRVFSALMNENYRDEGALRNGVMRQSIQFTKSCAHTLSRIGRRGIATFSLRRHEFDHSF